MGWSAAVVPVLVAAAVLLIPGLAVTASIGLRGLPSVASAPAVTTGIVGLSAIVAPMVGMRWSLLPVGITTLGAAFVLGTLRRVVARARPEWNLGARPHGRQRYAVWAPIVAVLCAAVIIGLRFAQIFGHPDAISQTFDNVFHLNAIRYILDTHDGSSLSLTSMTSGDKPPYFYPAAWHDAVALVAGVTQAPIPVAATATNLVIGALAWPLSTLLLVTSVRRMTSLGLVLSGALSAAFAGFPYLLVDFGVLYPNFLAYTLVPPLLALIAALFGLPSALSRSEAIALVLPISTGVALAHPNGLMTSVAFGTPILLVSWLRNRRIAHQDRRRRRRVTALHLGLLALAAAAWIVVRPPRDQITWGPVQNFAQASGEALLNDGMGRPTAVAASLLTIFAAWRLIKCRSASSWLVGSWVIAMGLFVIVSGTNLTHIRTAATGVWYNDSFRLASALPLIAAPLAGVGSDIIVSLIGRWRARRNFNPRPTISLVAGVALVAVAVLVTQPTGVPAEIRQAATSYRATPQAGLLSPDELELIQELPRYVPADATIAVDPWTGSSLAYALANRNVTYRHIYSSPTADTRVIDAGLRNARPGSAVCGALARSHVEFVLDFGSYGVFGPTTLPPGLSDLSTSAAVTEVARTGPEAVLYRISGCS